MWCPREKRRRDRQIHRRKTMCRHTGRCHEPRGRDGAMRPQAKERHGRPAAPEAGDGQEWVLPRALGGVVLPDQHCRLPASRGTENTCVPSSDPPGGALSQPRKQTRSTSQCCAQTRSPTRLVGVPGAVSLTSSFPNCSVFIATCPAIRWRKIRFVSLWSSFQSYRLPFPPTAPRVKSVHMTSVVERQLM